jgi:hypothetical protein
VNFHFTARPGVAVQVVNAGNDEVAVLITMNSGIYRAAPLPRKRDWDISFSFAQSATDVINWVQFGNAIGHPIAGFLIDRDWLADRYDPPIASSALDLEIARMAVQDLGGNTPFSIDDRQPFPIYGQLRVQWERH